RRPLAMFSPRLWLRRAARRPGDTGPVARRKMAGIRTRLRPLRALAGLGGGDPAHSRRRAGVGLRDAAAESAPPDRGAIGGDRAAALGFLVARLAAPAHLPHRLAPGGAVDGGAARAGVPYAAGELSVRVSPAPGLRSTEGGAGALLHRRLAPYRSPHAADRDAVLRRHRVPMERGWL